MAVLLVEDILDGAILGPTSGLDDLLIAEVGGRRVLYALNRAEARLIEIDVGSSGDLTVAGSLTLQGSFQAGVSPKLGMFNFAAGAPALAISGVSETSGQSVVLSGVGALTSQQALTGLGVLTAGLGLESNGTSVLLNGWSSGGLAYYSDAGSGFAQNMILADAQDRYLADVAATIAFEQVGLQYVASVSSLENGLSIAEVSGSGLTHVGALGNAEGLPIGAPMDIAVFSRIGETILAIASNTSSSISLVRVDDGVPFLADHVLDNNETRFAGAGSVAALAVGDFAYLAVGGAEGGVSLFTVLPGGRLVYLDSIAEDETVPLDQVDALEMWASGGVLNVYAGSLNEPGLTHLEFDVSTNGDVVLGDGVGSIISGTALDDQVIGLDISESIVGLSGDDILSDGAGNDTLTGGDGADLFVFTADAQTDTILDFDRTADALDLSAFDFLRDVSQLGISQTADGAVLTFGSEAVVIHSSDGNPLSVADFDNSKILNVDRPPYLLVGRDIQGGAGDDTLSGGPGDDTIAGSDGQDELYGQGGNDSIDGGVGIDLLLGAAGNDTLSGMGGADTLSGGAGDDLLWGGDGADALYGDDIA